MNNLHTAIRPSPQFKASGVVQTVAVLMILGTGSDYAMHRAREWQQLVKSRMPILILDASSPSKETAGRLDVRLVCEHIENIRKVLSPSVADLATLFDVSRQSIYKWMAGDSMPEQDKWERIAQLSRIADDFRIAGISRAGALLKMKAFDGLSLMDIFKAGKNSNNHVSALIGEAKAMENSYQKSGLAASKAKSTSDWQSSISIPGTHEQA